ncbi:MAG TPA: hydroxyacylglutathione hydrolase [Methylovirgula sp.]|nr:hydroxyacylglutathione hydrolase [Methylovirgula sp.]
MSLEIRQFLCLEDNLGVLVQDPESGATASIDAPDAAPILAALAMQGWALTDILLTHHHADHIQGLGGLKSAFPQARVIGPADIGGIDRAVDDGDEVCVGTRSAKAIAVPGHTLDHLAYWFERDKLLFAGDALFAMGCGRAFEAPPAVLYRSLMRLASLPDDTLICCGHEYTLANARFALRVDPDNEALQRRAQDVAAARAEGRLTLPTRMGLERATNPFLRVHERAIQERLGLAGADPAEVFTALRELKNRS